MHTRPLRSMPSRLLPVLVAVALTIVGLASPAAAAAPSCHTDWGSAAKGASTPAPVRAATLLDVRAGRHACYDRLVLEVRGPSAASAWRVEYVRRVVEDPTGKPVPLRGGADLQIVAGVSDHTEEGAPTYRPADRRALVPVSGYRTFRQVAWAGSFEGLTTIGVGVRARLPFRVLLLPTGASSARLVVDVAHTW